jgi:hypothetical protein
MAGIVEANEIFRHRKSRLPIVYGAGGFFAGSRLKGDGHFVGCCGHCGRNCVVGCQRQ